MHAAVARWRGQASPRRSTTLPPSAVKNLFTKIINGGFGETALATDTFNNQAGGTGFTQVISQFADAPTASLIANVTTLIP